MSDGRVPVFYVNVAARTDRRAFMENQFAALGVAAERIEATTPADIPADVAAASRRPDGTPRLGLGEIACTLSHLAAWQRAIDGGAAACAVFEDDGVISGRFPRFLDDLGPSLPDGIDLLKFETSRRRIRLGRHILPLAGLSMRKLTSTHYGNCGYVISTRRAARLIATMPVASLPIDDQLFGRHGDMLFTGRVYQLVPALTIQLVYQHTPETADLARSDLDRLRVDKPPQRKDAARGARNLTASWRELIAFGHEVLNTRVSVPFADDP